MWRVLGVVVVAGCGRIGFDARTRDATGTDGGAAIDTALGSFGAPAIVPELANPAFEGGPSLTEDMLEIFFESSRSETQGDIFTATRTSVTGAWSAPTIIMQLSSAGFVDGGPAISPDGLTIMFHTNRGGADEDIYVSTRPSRMSTWQAPTRLDELDTLFQDLHPAFSHSGLEASLESGRPGSDGEDVYLATRATPGGVWRTPVRIVEVATAANEVAPGFGASDLDLYFAQLTTTNDNDIFVAHRAAVGAMFGAPTALTELASPASDSSPWVSLDGRTIYFHSNRTGNTEIYMATR